MSKTYAFLSVIVLTLFLALGVGYFRGEKPSKQPQERTLSPNLGKGEEVALKPLTAPLKAKVDAAKEKYKNKVKPIKYGDGVAYNLTPAELNEIQDLIKETGQERYVNVADYEKFFNEI